ncbi:hypothetical protein [Massilia sp. Se16.2.3]|uniref:hypothetical protein n=1 Tax=Massilia sp. Se16.2.3 TaxID=2709303 RepID=UPI0016029A17|nr:hypothetical protein [Massilia sp. Se16.2.3]QNB01146.1 hypothetical protein G4G31_23860 [Massilia sp. Se16.2.3]
MAAQLTAGSWRDPQAHPYACYAVEAQFAGSGNRSHHSQPQCAGPVSEIAVLDARVSSNVKLAATRARPISLAGAHRPTASTCATCASTPPATIGSSCAIGTRPTRSISASAPASNG